MAGYCPRILVFLRLILSLLLLQVPWAVAAVTTTDGPDGAARTRWLTSATLSSAAGQREVSLAHMLTFDDFPAAGGRVRYRLLVTLNETEQAYSLYVKKMSRSGRVFLNGNDLGSCGPLELELLRCHHQPQFLRPDPRLWRVGENVIEIEIYATRQQANGLSPIAIGPTEALYREAFRPRLLWSVELIDALSWLAYGFGLLSLMFYWVFRSDRLYLWFGLTCVMNGVSNLNVLVTAPLIDYGTFDWLMFSSRIVYTCLLGLAFLAFFRRDRPWHIRSLLAYAAFCPLAIWWSDNDPKVLSVLYLPLQLVAVMLAGASLWWALRSRKAVEWIMALAFLVNPVAGVLDMQRLRWQSGFEGVYLLVYTSALTLVLVGVGLVGVLAVALRASRDFSGQLERRVTEREASLHDAYDRVLALENARARAEERERMMRDMHDGFMSTLAITRVALESGRSGVAQAARYIGDCIDDLRLILDATGNAAGSLEDLLADFRHRVESRLRGTDIETSWDITLDGLPEFSSSSLLQIMRIVQEACNNALRHANCTELHVGASWDAEFRRLTIEIADNGLGMREPISTGGRGLKNMRFRAGQLGGQLGIDSGADGTRVWLTIQTRSDAELPN